MGEAKNIYFTCLKKKKHDVGRLGRKKFRHKQFQLSITSIFLLRGSQKSNHA